MKIKNLGLFLIVIFLISCTQPTKTIKETPQIDIPQIQQEIDLTQTETTIKKPEENKATEKAKLVLPELTYENAYNGQLYDTSFQAGDSAPIDQVFKNFDRNGVSSAIMFFSLENPPSEDSALVSNTGLGYMLNAIQKNPGRIIPFFNKGTSSKETRDLLGPTLTNYYKETAAKLDSISPKTIEGIGELKHYDWQINMHSKKMTGIFDIAKENKLFIMIHPKIGEVNHLKTILKIYPDVIFLVHYFPADFSKNKNGILRLLEDFDNIYFSVDVDHMTYDGKTGLLHKYEDDPDAVNKFISDFDANYNERLSTALLRYRDAIEKHPDKFMWGTEVSLSYTHDPEVYDRIIKFSRLFIAELPEDVQEDFAYKNAQMAFGPGVTLKKEFEISDASNTISA